MPGAALLGQGSPGAESASIELSQEQGRWFFRVSGWDPAGEQGEDVSGRWADLFSVYVESAEGSSPLPPILGSYSLREGMLHFYPRFPLEPGLRYRAVFEADGHENPLSGIFLVPREETFPSTIVDQVYPSADLLPANQLKFYLHFSTPMSRGEAYRRIHLLDENGNKVDMPFLELDEELWDAQGQRLTIFFDPGRVKRGLVPHNQVGAPLEEGRRYTLAVDPGWPDAAGIPLKEEFRKPFRAGPDDRESPDPGDWNIASPAEGTTEPLAVEFSEPMDHGLLHRLLGVRDPEDAPVLGSVQVDQEETRWRFVPERPWGRGRHTLEVSTTLEDLAGNKIDRLFEVDRFDQVENEVVDETVRLTFDVRANH